MARSGAATTGGGDTLFARVHRFAWIALRRLSGGPDWWLILYAHGEARMSVTRHTRGSDDEALPYQGARGIQNVIPTCRAPLYASRTVMLGRSSRMKLL